MALIDKLTNLSSFDYNKVGEDSYNQSKNKNPHPIADVETQYDKFNPDDGQLIQKDIGERYTFSSGDNVSIDGGLIRGGAAVSAQRIIDDEKRLGKFLTTPKGALFAVKQGILQAFNKDKTTNIYDPSSVLKNAATPNFSGFARFDRHFDETGTNFSKDKSFFENLGEFFSALVSAEVKGQYERQFKKTPNPQLNDNSVDFLSGKEQDEGIRKPKKITDVIPKPYASLVDSGDYKKEKKWKVKTSDPEKFDGKGDYNIGKLRSQGNLNMDTAPNYDKLIKFGYDNYPTGDRVKSLNRKLTPARAELESAIVQHFDTKAKHTRTHIEYGGTFGTLSDVKNKTIDGKPGMRGIDDDFIKFKIRDAVNGKWIVFPAFLTAGISDNSSATYSTTNYIGRPDAVHVYQNRTRTVSFGFRVVALNESEIPIIWEKMNALKGLTNPEFRPFFSKGESDTGMENATRPVAPFVYLTIGDMFVNTPGYFTSIGVNVGSTANWETKDGRQFPHVCDVSCEFVYIGKETPTMLGKNYEDERSKQKAKERAANITKQAAEDDKAAKQEEEAVAKKLEDAKKKALDRPVRPDSQFIPDEEDLAGDLTMEETTLEKFAPWAELPPKPIDTSDTYNDSLTFRGTEVELISHTNLLSKVETEDSGYTGMTLSDVRNRYSSIISFTRHTTDGETVYKINHMKVSKEHYDEVGKIHRMGMDLNPFPNDQFFIDRHEYKYPELLDDPNYHYIINN